MPVKSLGRGKSAKASKKKNLTRKKNNTKRKGNKTETRNQKGGWWPWSSKLTKNEKYNIAIERASKLPLGSRKYTLTRPADQTPLTDKERQEIQEIKTKRLKYLPDTKRKR